jgi:site-specific recombinase XerD
MIILPRDVRVGAAPHHREHTANQPLPKRISALSRLRTPPGNPKASRRRLELTHVERRFRTNRGLRVAQNSHRFALISPDQSQLVVESWRERSVNGINCSTRAIKYLDQAQLEELFAAARKASARDRLLVTLLYRYGLRISEALGLRTEDIDIRRGEIRVVGLKGGATRVYAIGRDIAPLFRKIVAPGRFLFASRESERLSRSQAWLRVKALMREAGIPSSYGPHALRHSLAVHMLDAGLRLEHVKDALRHASIRSTEVYADLSSGARAEYTRRMEQSSSIVKVRS